MTGLSSNTIWSSVGIGFFLSFCSVACAVAAEPLTIDASHGSDIQIFGNTAAGVSIASVTTGDINGDQVNDIVLAGRASSPVAVILGKKTFSNVIQFSETVQPDIKFSDMPKNSHATPLLHVGDLNGDGMGDLFFPHANGVQVYFGRKQWPKHIQAGVFPADLDIRTADAVDAERTFGYTFVTTGDVNGDGRTDIFLTRTVYAFPSKPRVWKAQSQLVGWLFLGRKHWPSVIDLSKQPADMVMFAEQPDPESHASRQVLMTDLNHDGYDDIVVGAWGKSYGMFLYDEQGPWDTAWIISGRAQLPSKLSLNATVAKFHHPDVAERNEPPVLRLAPSELGMIFGAGIAAGDVTGDGIQDLVLNLFQEQETDTDWWMLWRPCLLPGRADFFAKGIGDPLMRCQFVTGRGLERVKLFGTKPLIIGDFNGDLRDDVFLGLVDQSFVMRGLLGQAFSRSPIDLNWSATITILPPKLKDSTHPIFTHMTLGDVNGDGHADLLMVEPLGGAATASQIGPGTLHIVLGKEIKIENKMIEIGGKARIP